jgi:hypothetical protein
VYWAARRVLSSHLREGADRWNAAAAERMEEDVVDKVMVEGGVGWSQGAQSVSTLMLISFQLSSSSFELQLQIRLRALPGGRGSSGVRGWRHRWGSGHTRG